MVVLAVGHLQGDDCRSDKPSQCLHLLRSTLPPRLVNGRLEVMGDMREEARHFALEQRHEHRALALLRLARSRRLLALDAQCLALDRRGVVRRSEARAHGLHLLVGGSGRLARRLELPLRRL